MSRFYWLASYPKSGNTWMRLLISSLMTTDEMPVDLNDLLQRGIASGRSLFDRITLLDSGLLTYDEIDRMRPDVYAALAREQDDTEMAEDEDQAAFSIPHFIKVHDAYGHLPDGRALLGGADAASGAVVVVRDPRAVVPSLADHNGVSLDEAIAWMANPDAAYCETRKQQKSQFRHQLRDWSGHIASWLDQTDLPVHVIRYEDLSARTADELLKVMQFAGHPIQLEQAERAARLCRFDRLKSLEQEVGFKEKSRKADSFFRKGKTDSWQQELTAAQIETIEQKHAQMMTRLGYELSA